MKKEYTAEETYAFKAARNAKTRAYKQRKRNPVMVFLSKYAPDYYEKYGITAKGKSFIGSIRQQFTGARRNNQLSA